MSARQPLSADRKNQDSSPIVTTSSPLFSNFSFLLWNHRGRFEIEILVLQSVPKPCCDKQGVRVVTTGLTLTYVALRVYARESF